MAISNTSNLIETTIEGRNGCRVQPATRSAYVDPEKNRAKALNMFLDQKVFKPGEQEFKRA